MDILNPLVSGLPITILWLGGSIMFAYALFGGKK